MSIPYMRKINLQESHFKMDRNVDDETLSLINESLGAFEKQYELTNKIASFAFYLLANNRYDGELSIDSEIVDKVFINLDIKSLWGCAASLNLIKDKCLYMTISFTKDYLMLSKSKFIDALSDPISHELMHYHIFVERDKNKVIPNDKPLYYDNLIKIIQDEKFYNTLVSEFAYGLYATYYQEVSAMVSQAVIQFKNFLMNQEKTHKNANSALKQCNSFIVYNNILKHTVPIINRMSDYEINKEIVSFFNENGIECDIKWARKQTKKMFLIAKYALHNVIRNVSYKFYN